MKEKEGMFDVKNPYAETTRAHFGRNSQGFITCIDVELKFPTSNAIKNFFGWHSPSEIVGPSSTCCLLIIVS